jgi:hypothetical protein
MRPAPIVSVSGAELPTLLKARLVLPDVVAAVSTPEFDRVVADSGTKHLRVRIETEGSEPEDIGVMRVERYGEGSDSLVALQLAEPSAAPFELVETEVEGVAPARLAEVLREFLSTTPPGEVPPTPLPPGDPHGWSLVCILFRICRSVDPRRP